MYTRCEKNRFSCFSNCQNGELKCTVNTAGNLPDKPGRGDNDVMRGTLESTNQNSLYLKVLKSEQP